MQRIATLACAALALGMFAAPLGAQQTPQEQPIPETSQPAPPETELPPPPPFPPMPSARPSKRWVDVGGHHSSHASRQSASTRHHAARTRHHAAKAKHRRAHARHGTAYKARVAHFSRATIRACHKMNYRQILRHSSCRLLIKQELAATAHHAKRHHKKSTHKARRHHSRKRHRR
jgi:hypothetical protein